MSDFEVQYTAARQMAQKHEDAAEAVVGQAESMPGSIDGGIGGPKVMAIIAAIGRDAGKVATVQSTTAGRVRTAVDLFKGFDAGAAADMARIGESLKGE